MDRDVIALRPRNFGRIVRVEIRAGIAAFVWSEKPVVNAHHETTYYLRHRLEPLHRHARTCFETRRRRGPRVNAAHSWG